MFYPTKYDCPAVDRSAGTAQLPPERGQSVTLFVSTFLFGAIGLLALIAMIASAPTRVTFPLAFVFVAYAIGVAAASLAEHRHGAIMTRRATATRMSPVSRVHEPRERDAAPSTLSAAWLALAIGSLALLGVAFVVPADVGSGFAATGLVGLLILRLSAHHARWAPRGAVGTIPDRSVETSTTLEKVSTVAPLRPVCGPQLHSQTS